MLQTICNSPLGRQWCKGASLSPNSFLIDAVLFDLDGVLVDSRGVVEVVWRRWAAAHGLDPAPFIAVAHGRRTSETIRLVAPRLDSRREAAELDAMEETETEGLAPIPGAAELLSQLPGHRWGIVTSGSVAIATLRLRTAGLPVPPVMITGDRVHHGKPEPEGYLLGASSLGLKPAGCLVFEDAPIGIEAARRAGMRAVGVATTHRAEDLSEAALVVENLRAVTPTEVGSGQLEIRCGPGHGR